MSVESAVHAAFERQVQWCEKLGSPLTARLLDGLSCDLDRSTRCGRMVLDWPGDPDALGDAVPLRLAGALNGLVRAGRLSDLAALYPPNPLPAAATLRMAVLAALKEFDEDICEWLALAPQTNEVARSSVLYPGLMFIAARTGLPLAVHEIGASAGLNLVADRYAYRIGKRSCGRQGSPLSLSPQWSGPDPDGPDPVLVERSGCDLNPFDLAKPADRDRLIAYVWPDQLDRIQRIETAVGIALEQLPRLDRADAAQWVRDVVAPPPRNGVATVLMHSIMFQYLPDDVRDRIRLSMEEAGERARADAPLAWLAFEQFESEGPRLTVRLWPGGGDERVLGRADPHCRAVHWC